MSLQVITHPRTLMINGHMCSISNAFNPVYADVVRKDHVITSAGVSGGKLKLYIADTSDFYIGQSTYHRCLSLFGAVISSGVVNVLDVQTTYIILDTAFVGGIVAGYVNIITGIKREVELTATIESGSDVIVIDVNRRFSYDSTGTARCYLNGIVKDSFDKFYSLDYTVNNHFIDNACFKLNITFADVDNPTQTAVLTDSYTYYAANSVAQIRQDNRMVDFEAYSTETINSTANFLTAFVKPVMFRNYPFTLSALIGENADNVYHRNMTGANYSVFTDYLVEYTYLGIYALMFTISDNVKQFKTALICRSKESELYLKINEAGDNLLINEDGNKLRIR